jgi:ubiquinone/menaquinone biosynthesis C-methylase UbiE
MSVSNHLHIAIDEYDKKIRTFVPHYETMIGLIEDSVSLVRGPSPTIVDMGIGTGALANACLKTFPKARMIGIDLDAGMLDLAKRRLTSVSSVEYIHEDFCDIDLPQADAVVACVSLHHIRTPLEKQKLYARIFKALNKGGVFLSADYYPAVEPSLARRHRVTWLGHLQQSYSPSESEQFLQAWSGEDVYFPLEDELTWIQDAGFRPEVVWRKDGFAVMAGFREK